MNAFLGAIVLAAAVPGAWRPAMAATLPVTDEPLSTGVIAFDAPGATVQADTRTRSKVSTIVLVGNRKSGKETGAEAYERGGELHEDEHYLEAAAEYVKAVELGYREDSAAYNAACAYARAGRKDDAFTWLSKAIEFGFDVGSYLRKDDDLDSLRDDARFAELKKAAKAAKANESGAESARALRRFERLTTSGSKSGAKYYAVGKELLDADQYGPSEKAFRTAAKLGYREGASIYNAACALARAGQAAPALDTLDAALEAGFDDPRTLEGDHDLESLHDQPRFAQLKKKAEDLSLSLFDLGAGFSRLFARRAAWRAEVPRLVAYAKAHPRSGRAQYNVGYAQLLGDRPEEAVAAFTRAVELGYRKPTTLYNLACAHARLDEKDKAFERLFQAIDAGFDSRDQIRNDDDLDSLHGDPRFKKALERAEARADDSEG